jgi:hypothetical protein
MRCCPTVYPSAARSARRYSPLPPGSPFVESGVHLAEGYLHQSWCALMEEGMLVFLKDNPPVDMLKKIMKP